MFSHLSPPVLMFAGWGEDVMEAFDRLTYLFPKQAINLWEKISFCEPVFSYYLRG